MRRRGSGQDAGPAVISALGSGRSCLRQPGRPSSRKTPSRRRAPVYPESPEREVLRVEVILEVEDTREARAVPQRVFPRAIRGLRLDQIADALLDRLSLRPPRREETQERPRCLAGDGLAPARQGFVLVGGERLAPASVVVLPLLDPGNGALDVVGRAVLADGAEPAQHRPRAVDVVDAPASVPGACLVLGLADEAEGALGGGVIRAVAEGAEELEAAARQVLRRGIEEGPVIGEGNVVEDEPAVVGVEGGPPA